ncbi:MAG: hypothetical protein WCI74_10980 [Actinomycetes bacterium]
MSGNGAIHAACDLLTIADRTTGIDIIAVHPGFPGEIRECRSG